jgi:hypothetical protein
MMKQREHAFPDNFAGLKKFSPPQDGAQTVGRAPNYLSTGLRQPVF